MIFKSILCTLANFSKQFYFIASLASIVSIVIIILNENWAIYVALCFFCFMLLIFTSYLIYALFKIIETQSDDHENRSTFIKYETLDGNKITYEVYKVIQSKRPLLTEFEYSFKWSGTHLPKITSELQEVINVYDENDVSKYDRAILKFNKPLFYNKNCVVHFKADLDDTDHKSNPHVETRVINEIDVIHYRIILKNKPTSYKKNAVLYKKRISDKVSTDFEKIIEIAFDKSTKSYEYHLLNPHTGYYYKIQWDKN